MALKIGDRVKVRIDPFDENGTGKEIRRFNGLKSKVSAVKSVKGGCYYELENFKSDYGIPFSFVGDWLILCDESEGE